MQLDNINVSLGEFSIKNTDPAKLAAQIQGLREAGFRFTLQVNQPESMAVLQQLPAAMLKQEAGGLTMPRLLLLALVMSLCSILLGTKMIGLW